MCFELFQLLVFIHEKQDLTTGAFVKTFNNISAYLNYVLSQSLHE